MLVGLPRRAMCLPSLSETRGCCLVAIWHRLVEGRENGLWLHAFLGAQLDLM
jgi:hypothetical protein